jgi:hypothetical protein
VSTQAGCGRCVRGVRAAALAKRLAMIPTFLEAPLPERSWRVGPIQGSELRSRRVTVWLRSKFPTRSLRSDAIVANYGGPDQSWGEGFGMSAAAVQA